MVIARVWGGLGNQFFQYAAGYAVAKKLKTSLVLDGWRNDRDPNRPNELHYFKVTGRPWNKREQDFIERLIRIARPPDAQTSAWARRTKAITRPLLAPCFTYIEDQYCGYQPGIFDGRGHVYLAGTWASGKYFQDVADDIRAQFTFVQPPDEENSRMLEAIGAANAVCVHVRRGDYVSVSDTNKRHGLCSIDYYQTAYKTLADRIPDLKIFVFSDDPAWVQENLHFPCPTVYVTHNVGRQNSQDLRLMAACKHFIIANSTFSWWGAWLAPHAEKIVVAPRTWSHDPKIDDPVPDHWVRL